MNRKSPASSDADVPLPPGTAASSSSSPSTKRSFSTASLFKLAFFVVAVSNFFKVNDFRSRRIATDQGDDDGFARTEETYEGEKDFLDGREDVLDDKDEAPVTSNYTRPRLSQVMRQIRAGNLSAGQDALDFAVLGHAKCGTTTMLRWLEAHPEVEMFHSEVVLMQKSPPDMVKKIYMQLSSGENMKRGYKSPSDADSPKVARGYRQYFPKTKLIIGLRHPVRWFESFYNFRVQNGSIMPPVRQMRPTCAGGQKNVCILRAAYHNHLINFGKTNWTDPGEINLLTRFPRSPIIRKQIEEIEYVPNRIFLYDSEQLGDGNETRVANLQKDLQEHVGLRQPLPKPLHIKPGKVVEEKVQIRRDSRKIDICRRRHTNLRKQLLKIGSDASTWIIKYFLQSPDVIVPNREHFISILEMYSVDPCEEIEDQVMSEG